ncbi:hypothetical protein [Aquicoccus sp.]|uniref:hypothetical protein n=1 Tax=Aquicoccus sp. TaxID=2055851 RepID=UPI00356747FF
MTSKFISTGKIARSTRAGGITGIRSGDYGPVTNLYNARHAWLDHTHSALDEAVAEAYGWGDDWRVGVLTDDEILARLFRLNQARA